MRDVAIALVPVLEEAGVSVDERGDALVSTLEQLDAEARTVLSVVPPERRRLVTGHESLGYFADRYGFELVGAVVPGFSSQGEVSAGELAQLVETIRDLGVPAIFTEVGTPASVAAAVADRDGRRHRRAAHRAAARGWLVPVLHPPDLDSRGRGAQRVAHEGLGPCQELVKRLDYASGALSRLDKATRVSRRAQ